ncbi:MAG: type II secretion system protein N, partial [Oceanobacter sp.]
GKLLFTVLIAWQLSVLIWQILAPTPLVLKEPSKGDGGARIQAQLNTAQYHLFGELGAEPVVEAKPVVVDAPDTRLKLTLLGVTVATDEGASGAIIAPSGREGDFYRVGDKVQGRTVLSAVYKDKVILDTSGKLETLKFEEIRASGSNVSRVANTADRPRVSGSATNVSRKSGGISKRLSKVKNAADFVEVATEELSSDAMGALTKMGLQAIGPDQGYRVTPNSPLRKFQLRPGDIVLSVNDQTLGDPEQDQSLLNDIRSADSVRIEVQRGDNRFTVNHQLDIDR